MLCIDFCVVSSGVLLCVQQHFSAHRAHRMLVCTVANECIFTCAVIWNWVTLMSALAAAWLSSQRYVNMLFSNLAAVTCQELTVSNALGSRRELEQRAG